MVIRNQVTCNSIIAQIDSSHVYKHVLKIEGEVRPVLKGQDLCQQCLYDDVH